MELRSRVFKVALTVATGLLVVAGSQRDSEAETYHPLCGTFLGVETGACIYAPPSAPVLRADVCSDGVTTVLKGTEACATGLSAYYAEHGEVLDPNLGTVQGYVPLDDACDQGQCVPKPLGAPVGEEGPVCCPIAGGECSPATSTCGTDEIALWCDDNQVPENNDGTWECHEES